MRTGSFVGVSVVFCLVLAGCQASSSTPTAPSVVADLATPSSSRLLSGAVPLAPEQVLVDQFTGQLDRAMRKAFRVPGAASLAGDLVVVPISARAAGTYTFPDPGGNQVTVPNDVSVATFVLNIALADKIALGKTLGWKFYFSADNGQTWIFRNGGGWTSGPFTDRFGVQNPDPVLGINVDDKRGQLIRGELRIDQPIEMGVTISTQ